MSILTAPETWPFAAALVTMVGLGVLEGLGMLFAVSPSLWLDATRNAYRSNDWPYFDGRDSPSMASIHPHRATQY